MLSKIKFTGFTVLSSNFAIHKIAPEGKFEVKLRELIMNDSPRESKDEPSEITISITPKLIGYALNHEQPDSYEDEPAFELSLELKMTFDNYNENSIDDSYFKENYWFFENFLAISMKLGMESVLKETVLRDIPLGWARPDIDVSIESAE